MRNTLKVVGCNATILLTHMHMFETSTLLILNVQVSYYLFQLEM